VTHTRSEATDFHHSNAPYAAGVALFCTIAVAIQELLFLHNHWKTWPLAWHYLFTGSWINLSIAAVLTFVAGWLGSKWIRKDKPPFVRAGALTIVVPCLAFALLAFIGGVMGGTYFFQLAWGVLSVTVPQLGLPCVIATGLWSSLYLWLSRKQS
jgi:hypothetical protein